MAKIKKQTGGGGGHGGHAPGGGGHGGPKGGGGPHGGRGPRGPGAQRDHNQKQRGLQRDAAAAANPLASGSTNTPPDTTDADTITGIATQDPSAYLQQELNQMHGGLTAGTSYDQWLNDYYNPSQIAAWNQYRVDNVAKDPTFDQWVKDYQTVADAQFQYAHRPDTQRSLNPFEGGGSHWSWFD